MAAFGMVPAALGFRFDLTQGMLGFLPKCKEMKRCFWSLGTVWGEYRMVENGVEIWIADGRVDLKKLLLDFPVSTVKCNGNTVGFTQNDGVMTLDVLSLSAGDLLHITAKQES